MEDIDVVKLLRDMIHVEAARGRVCWPQAYLWRRLSARFGLKREYLREVYTAIYQLVRAGFLYWECDTPEGDVIVCLNAERR